ncbi:MAG TPA: enoyl-CoA hydratase-related protein [Mycobacteriales bacterium]|jgi:enoyl-CoA hydratase/carnithine racemase|nr:enoyl-CoA hydratase-related protein [Mycobacteriales bacterium]
MTDFSEIGYDVAGGILTITLSRPDALNAFTAVMAKELLQAFDAADADDDVRAVIVTGAGRAFCAGADLSGGGQTFDAERSGQAVDEAARDGGGRVSLRIFESTKPVIAAINGPAVGVGLTMTLPMDVRVAGDTAKFGFVFTRRGIVPEAASSWFLPRLVGPSQAAEWFYTGRVFGPEEALAGRLIRSVHPASEVVDAARSIALEMTESTSSVSVALARQMMWRGLTYPTPYRSHAADSRGIHVTGRSGDAIEGITSFLQKRSPSFPDKVSAHLPDIFSDPQPSWAADLPI